MSGKHERIELRFTLEEIEELLIFFGSAPKPCTPIRRIYDKITSARGQLASRELGYGTIRLGVGEMKNNVTRNDLAGSPLQGSKP